MQAAFSGGNGGSIDRADVVISAVAGNSFIFAALGSAMFDIKPGDGGLVTAADKGLYKTSVEVSTGLIFGGLGGAAGGALGGTGGILTETVINGYGGLFNYTLAPPAPPK